MAALLSGPAWPGRAAAPALTSAPAPLTSPATSATVPLVRDADLGVFFPPRPHPGNAAAAYTKAFDLYDSDRDRTRYWEKWDVLLGRRLMRAALDQLTSGGLCQSCDFLPFLPDDLSRATKFPYLAESQGLAKLASVRWERELGAGRRDDALATARTLMAFGRHLRGSALVLSQDLQGLTIERLAVVCFRKTYGPKADALTSAKLTVISQLLDASQQFIQSAVQARQTAGDALSADLQWLHSAHPVLRCEAILNIAQETFPPPVLTKPTPSIDVGALLEKLAGATSGTKVRVRREEVETKIQWPRKGIRPDVTAEDVTKLRAELEPLAKSDPDTRVRALAQRFLDALAEPLPQPPMPGPGALPTTRPLQIPPPPRPPLAPLTQPSTRTLFIPPPPKPPSVPRPR